VASLTMGIGNVLVSLVSKAMIFSIFTWVPRFAIFHIGYDGHGLWPFSRTTLATTGFTAPVAGCRFFRASHVVHHLS